MASVACKLMLVLSVYIFDINKREYIYENNYTLEFMRWKFYELLEKSGLRIAHWVDNPNVRK